MYAMPKNEAKRVLIRTADALCRARLRHDRESSTKLRKRLVRLVGNYTERWPQDAEAWIILGDISCWRRKKHECYEQVLKIDSGNAEAHAEIGLLLAESGNPTYLRHCRRAMRRAGNTKVADVILYTVLEAARAAGNETLAAEVLRLARSKFPNSTLFDDAEL